MVHDQTGDNPTPYPFDGEGGYTIHQSLNEGYPEYEIYSDDGQGNGDFICKTPDIYWARTIAQALDNLRES